MQETPRRLSFTLPGGTVNPLSCTRCRNSLAKEGFLNAYADFFPITSEREMIGKFASAVFRGIGRGVDPEPSTIS